MVVDANTLRLEQRKFPHQIFQPVVEGRPNSQMSNAVGKRNLLRLNLEIEKRNSGLNNKAEEILENTVTCQTDVNRNSVIDAAVDINPEDICEVITTEITERKTKKKTSAIHTIRNLVRATVITSPSDTTPINEDRNSKNENCTENSDELKKDSKVNRRKKSSVASKMRKKRNRSRAIPNEGASLWTPVENCWWRSAGGRKVHLDEIDLNRLCEAERNALKKIALYEIHQKGLENHVTIPKEHHAGARRRWKQLLNIKKKGKTDTSEKANDKPVNPVFSVDLFQVIENDKAVEKAHEIAMAKLDQVGEELEKNEDEIENRNDSEMHLNISNDKLFERRNSDPIIFEHKAYSYDQRDYADTDVSDYMLNALRTIDTLKEEDEEDSISNKRKSRLIEALTLSSTSASSMCILDREVEFKPPSPQVPKVMVNTVDYISKYALNIVGIFRTGGSKKRVRQMKEDYDNGYACVITEESNPHDVAALFKEFLRCLHDPLLTRELYPAFLSCAKLPSKLESAEAIKNLIWLLPVPNRDTLQVTLDCLRSVADNSQDREDEQGNLITGNKMDSVNLATLMAPNILHRCKTYKNSQAYQVDGSLNTEDNKASIDVVDLMINHNEDMFRIPGEIHHEVLLKLLAEDPETVDYVLRRKSTRTSLVEVISGVEEEIDFQNTFTGRRPSSAGPRTKYTHEEVSFYKSNSFNQGPYKPFIRKRKESTGSRPTSVKSDPPDRSSMRRSGMGTPPSRQHRNSSKSCLDGEESDYSKRDSSSPRDSGVVLSASTPPFKRNSLRNSFDSRTIVRRQQSRDRDSRDSAYDSGIQGLFPNRMSGTASIQITEDQIDLKDEEIKNNSETNLQKSPTVFLAEVLDAPSFLSPKSSSRIVSRKISLPAFSYTERHIVRKNTKSTSVDGDVIDFYQHSKDTEQTLHKVEWNNDTNWSEWNLNPRESQFPSQETTL